MRVQSKKPRIYNVSKLFRRQDELGWTDTYLAKLTGLSSVTIGRVRKGQGQRKSTVKSIADALGISLADVVHKEAKPI